jgi:choline dehydrogenase
MYQVTQRGGLRASAAAAYLHPATSRSNLTVLPNMLVHRVLFEGTCAVGVEASQLGHVQELRAAREVIVCAGAYNSPQLLMLSGVGPAEHLLLRELEVVLDQPAVGENLSDHAATFGVWGTAEPESLLLAREPAALEEFMATQTGPFASNLAESGAFVRVEDGAPAPDVQFHTIPVQILDEGMADPEGHGVLVTPCLLTPEARGSVRLASNDPTARPIVRNGFYESARDLDRMVSALRLMLEIAGQAMASYCATGMNVPDDDSDAALAAHARRTTFPIYHPVGTCAMGSVVDEQLRVNGLDGLRVVDASVMPLVPRGNTNAPTIAVAERAADLIAGGPLLQPNDLVVTDSPVDQG